MTSDEGDTRFSCLQVNIASELTEISLMTEDTVQR